MPKALDDSAKQESEAIELRDVARDQTPDEAMNEIDVTNGKPRHACSSDTIAFETKFTNKGGVLHIESDS